MNWPSETSKCRHRLAKYCQGCGVDIGYGGDPIVPSAITVDLPVPAAHVGNHPLNLGGDATRLFWFKSDVLDYVFSSHLLEDFKDTESVLREWVRVLKPGGYLILFGPDEQIYRAHCARTGQPYNAAHKIDDFSLSHVKQILLNKLGGVEIVHENPLVDVYSFELVARKQTTSNVSKLNLDVTEMEPNRLLEEIRQNLIAFSKSNSYQIIRLMRRILRKPVARDGFTCSLELLEQLRDNVDKANRLSAKGPALAPEK